MKDDTISRQAVLDAVEGVDWYHQNKNGEMVHGANSDEHQAWYKAEDIYKAIESVPTAQPECEDAVPRTSVEYICRKNTVSTNPYEHKYHDKFIQFMDDPEISDFGRWKHSNGFNTALVAVKCDLDKVPPVTPKKPGWIPCTTETMPKNKSNVLTVIYIPGRQAHIRSGWYEDGLFMNDNGDTWRATDKEVVGWMYQPKLPKPYREGGQE